MKVLSIQTGKPEPTPAKSGLTGHFKKPITGPVQIGPLGLSGDTICDLDNHGGVDQAVYLFGEPDRVWWQAELGRELPAGFFGENLLISDLLSADLAVGEKLTIGDVMLEITAPRIPCATYAAHIGDPQAIKQFYRAARPGAYARVLQTGQITAGQPVEFTSYNGDRILIIESTRHYLRHFDDPDFLARVLTVPAHHKLRALAQERLSKHAPETGPTSV